MGKIVRFKERRWKAYEYAATAAAIRVTNVIAIGDIDLADADYRTQKLEEIGRVLGGLQKTTQRIPAAALLLVNWPILAQITIGRPRGLFASDSMGELLVESDPLGLHLMLRHWREIEAVAEALLRQGHVREAEALRLITAARLSA